MKDSKNRILNSSPYVGSTESKIIHSTEHPCATALSIPPSKRWYIRSIPKESGYSLCLECFHHQDGDTSVS